MPPYIPSTPQQFGSVEDLQAWVEDELLALAQSTVDTSLVVLTPVFKGVDKPRDGMVLYADGVHFNPGAGAGSYEYRAGAWHKLAEDVDFTALAEMETDITDLETAVAANSAAIAGPTDHTGFINGSNAPTGDIGEYLSAVVQRASPVALTASVPANVTSLVVPAGDWDVWGDCYFRSTFNDAGAGIYAALSLVSATLPTTLPFARGSGIGVFTTATTLNTAVTGFCSRFSFSSSTTIFLVAQCDDTITGAYGQIQARRRR